MGAKVNANFAALQANYLFAEVNRRVKEYQKAHPEADVIRMGIGDVTRPLAKSVVAAMVKASEEQGQAETFHGYGAEQGYEFLKDALRKYYAGFGVSLENDEIFISDGAKSDCGNILNIFSADNTVLVPDPVYPVYVDTNVMDGRNIVYMPSGE